MREPHRRARRFPRTVGRKPQQRHPGAPTVRTSHRAYVLRRVRRESYERMTSPIAHRRRWSRRPEPPGVAGWQWHTDRALAPRARAAQASRAVGSTRAWRNRACEEGRHDQDVGPKVRTYEAGPGNRSSEPVRGRDQGARAPDEASGRVRGTRTDDDEMGRRSRLLRTWLRAPVRRP